MDYLDQIQNAGQHLREHSQYQPRVGLILGSGLGSLADQIDAPEHYPYEELPGFPVSTVEGHQGRLVLGMLEGQAVVAMQGRIHYYEGYNMKEITFPLRVMIDLGIDTLIVTSACGALNPDWYPGALVLVKDHLNMMGANPLTGKNHDALGPRFPDMSEAYSPQLRRLGQKVAEDQGQEVLEGIHLAVSGPYFQTEAELRMFQFMGADTIGMSMIPEVIVAVHAGIQTLGIACVTDMAVPGMHHEALTHEKVMEIANQTRPRFIQLVKGIVGQL